MGFQGIPNMFGHTYEQPGQKSNFNSQITQNTATARKRIIDKYMQEPTFLLSTFKVKVESENVGLKLNIQKAKIMASGPITSWQIDGETVETVSDYV